MAFIEKHPASDCVVLELKGGEMALPLEELKAKLNLMNYNEYIILSKTSCYFIAKAVMAKEAEYICITSSIGEPEKIDPDEIEIDTSVITAT